MPSTYNGIGTHYYGKKNIQKRPGPCPHCGSLVELASYDTRLWFVVVFIPIIPLSRKRIIDYCPTCTRHYAMDADKWEAAKQLEVSGAMEKFRVGGTPEDAMAAHQQLVNFHQIEKAAEFRKTMLEKFPENAKVLAYLGAAVEHLGNLPEAEAFYERALRLRPDMPEARIGVASGCIRAGRPDEARVLLDFLEKPGASQLYTLEPIDRLARAYQNANRHDDALVLFAVIQKELPKLAEEKWFRQLVKKSEKSSGRKESQLPKLKFSWKRLFSSQHLGAMESKQNPKQLLLVLGVIFALTALGFVIANEYIRRHRMLHIVNGFPQAATVQIDGVGEFKNMRGRWTAPLAEGRYHAVISGPVREELDFDVRVGYFSRWFSDPAWVLNVGGGAILMRTTATYRQSDPPPPTVAFHFGKSFEYFPEITHPFEELPEEVQIESGSSRTLVGLQLFQGEPISVFGYYTDQRDIHAALDFAENWLRLRWDNEHMLRLYAATAQQAGQSNRLDSFLRTGLGERPVRIEWHRVYQGLHGNAHEHAALIAEYSRLLEADPANSALLYLRGRIESDRAVATDYFQRSTKADPNNPFPHFALSYERIAAGDWQAARQPRQGIASARSKPGTLADAHQFRARGISVHRSGGAPENLRRTGQLSSQYPAR
jgi:tetratricopeptide (TPR) repeat protein